MRMLMRIVELVVSLILAEEVEVLKNFVEKMVWQDFWRVVFVMPTEPIFQLMFRTLLLLLLHQ
jgi:hypothetical protein